MNSKLDELKKQKEKIEKQISQQNHKLKSHFGIGKNGDWYKAVYSSSPEETYIYYYFESNFFPMNSMDDPIYSCYVADLKQHCEQNTGDWEEKLTLKKISKEEAFKYL